MTLSDQLQAYDVDGALENHPNRILISCILLCEKNVVGAQVSRRYESSVSSYILFYPATVSRICKVRSTLMFHLLPVQLHLLVKCLCLCVSSSLERKGVYEEKKKKTRSMGNLKERGRGPFNLEISKTHLICHSDLRCFHLFAVQIVIRFSRKEGDLLPCFHFIKATLRYRPILDTPHLPVQFYKNLCTGNIFLMLFLYTDM